LRIPVSCAADGDAIAMEAAPPKITVSSRDLTLVRRGFVVPCLRAAPLVFNSALLAARPADGTFSRWLIVAAGYAMILALRKLEFQNNSNLRLSMNALRS